MGKILSLTFAAVVALGSTAAMADPVVDGVRDPQYTTTASVTYLPGAPNSNFQDPTPFSDNANYTISLFAGANSVYGYLKADRITGLPYANLYFDLNPSVNDGSDLGFELSNGVASAFVAGGDSSQPGFRTTLTAAQASVYAVGDTIEFSLANSLFTGPIATLAYFPGQTYTASTEPLTLRLSQSFGYSVAGGVTYGPNRLGAFTVGGDAPAGAVPEVATWAMMAFGVGAVGFAMRRRATVRTNVSFA